MRFLFLSLLIVAFPFMALAIEAPSAQMPLGADQVLRGSFTQETHIKGVDNPLRSTGHFVVAPSHGLIWNIQKPFPLSTIVTPQGSAQDIGGMIIKLPVKNLQHLYTMVGGAMAGDW